MILALLFTASAQDLGPIASPNATETPEESADDKKKSGSGNGSKSGSGSGSSSKSGSDSGKSGSSSGSSSKSGSDSSKSGSSSDGLGWTDDSGKILKSFKIGKWKFQPYIAPGGGVQIATGSGTSVKSGIASVNLGLTQKHKPWAGDAMVGVSYTTGSANTGVEFHVGESFGAREDFWGASLGLTGFYDTFYGAPTLGVDIPIEVIIGPKKYYGYLGYTPTYVSNPDRKVEGFANETSWNIGFGLKTKVLSGEVGIIRETNVEGTFLTPVVTLAWAG